MKTFLEYLLEEDSRKEQSARKRTDLDIGQGIFSSELANKIIEMPNSELEKAKQLAMKQVEESTGVTSANRKNAIIMIQQSKSCKELGTAIYNFILKFQGYGVLK